MRVGNKIKELRIAYERHGGNMGQVELAQLCGITRQHLGNIENNKTTSMTYELLARMVEIFELSSFDDLLDYYEERQIEHEID